MPNPIETACERLLTEYSDAPMLYLREMNLQTRLGELIRMDLLASESPLRVKARIREKSGKVTPGYLSPASFQVDRVQLELKVDGEERTDIVVFSTKENQQVTLTREKFGALDIQAPVAALDLDGLIEIKAAPSAYEGNCEGFRKDVLKLLNASERAGPCAFPWGLHFVLVDKSLSVGGFVAPGIYGSGLDWTEPRNKATPGFRIMDTPPASAPHCVNIWELPCSGANAPVRRRFAVPIMGY